MDMSNANSDRLAELLADRALHGLSTLEAKELLDAGADDESFELAAAAIDLAMFPPAARMPMDVRARLEAKAEQFVSGARAASTPDAPAKPAMRLAGTERGTPPATDSFPLVARLGWLAAAACLGLAIVAWWPSVRAGAGDTGTGGGQVAADLGTQRNELIARADDLVKCEWQDWAAEGQGPEIPGVKGDVVFSPKTQSGFMRFVGLPDNPGQCQYQLWIVDQRGMGQRVSGAIFDAHAAGGELIVPIAPRITVGKPVAFAVTIEQPGGTWVSDMKRRVVIASAKG
jgi:hypothetical protein